MSDWFVWWLSIEVVALCALPLCLLAFSRLPDRGYTLSKAFALLVVGYAFWLLNSVHLLPNHRGGIIAAMLLVALMAAAAGWTRRDALIDWCRRNWGYMLAVEVAFFYVFAMAVWLRSLVGQISGTEQPMDLMFLNAATRAEHFPPIDPWLSGETVAYYYFGYLIVAMAGQLAGVDTQIGYNIGFGMIAALALVGGFGVVFNLVKLHEPARERARVQVDTQQRRRIAVPAGGSGEREHGAANASLLQDTGWKPYIFGAAGALMLVAMGNITWLFKYMAGLGIAGDWLYDWIDVEGITSDQPMESWYPSEFFGFFGATRIFRINDAEPPFRVITEFPMFSFLLGDLHPHVMSLPFVLVVAALALTFFLSDEPLDLAFWLARPLLFAGSAVLLGGLAFVNTWDIVTLAFVLGLVALVHNWILRPEPDNRGPARDSFDVRDVQLIGIVALLTVGVAIFVLALLTPGPLLTIAVIGGTLAWLAAFAFYLLKGNSWAALAETAVRTVSFILPLTLLAVAAYIPFYESFSSQAGGVLPVVTRPPGVTVPGTRPLHILIFWLPLVTAFAPFVALRVLEQRARVTPRALLWAAALSVAIVVAWAALFVVAVEIVDTTKLTGASGFVDQILDRGVGWIAAIMLGALLAAAILALWLEATRDDRIERAPLFSLILGTTALLLIMGTEFFYIDDVFHVRMNTVFKLYYQAWLLLAMAGGFALYTLASNWRLEMSRERVYRYAWSGAVIAVMAAAALYTVGGTMNRVRPYDAAGNRIEERRGLDGLARFPADELAAIAWLKEVGDGQRVVIAEAVGNDYTLAGRISASTGVPTVLGWAGHEDQWRGSSAPRAGRFEDIQSLYQGDMATVERIVNKYGITYIYVGELERTTYGEAALAKFKELPVAFSQGTVTVYQAAPAAVVEAEGTE